MAASLLVHNRVTPHNLTMPDGSLMFEFSISALQTHKFDKIIFICLKKHLEYIDYKRLKCILLEYNENVSIVILEAPTSCQSETVYEGLKREKHGGSFFIKDCDNNFFVPFMEGNYASTALLSPDNDTKAINKSYITCDGMGYVSNIAEKKIISDQFCCGGYSFENSEEFCSTFKSLDNSVGDDGEI